jgi:hypothetical protein
MSALRTAVNPPKTRRKAIRAQRKHVRSLSNRSSNFLFIPNLQKESPRKRIKEYRANEGQRREN